VLSLMKEAVCYESHMEKRNALKIIIMHKKLTVIIITFFLLTCHNVLCNKNTKA